MATKLSDDELTSILKAVPQRIVGRMLGGRQTVHLQRLADRWGFPVTGRNVDLFAVMARLWAFLKQYAPMLQVLMEDTGDENGDALGVKFLKAKIRKVQADATMAELRAAQKENSLVDRATIHEALQSVAARINGACDRAQRKWGPDGFEFFSELVEAIRGDIAATVASDTDDKRPAGEAALKDVP